LAIRWILFSTHTRVSLIDSTNQAVEIKPSFDCGRAKTATETTICRETDLASKDRAMAAAYHLRLSQLTPADAKTLRHQHAKWFHAYQQTCNPLVGDALKNCISTLLFGHTTQLAGWVSPNYHSAEPLSRTESLTDIGCFSEPYQKSGQHNEQINITFVNNTSENRQVLWLDYEGRRVMYLTLSAHESHIQNTFITHRWLIADPYGMCRQIFVVGSGPETTAVIEK